MAEEEKNRERAIGSQKNRSRNYIARSGKSWFLGIGINQYQEFSKLNNAVKDVEDIRDLLLAEYDIDANHTAVLFDAEATREAIIDHLDQLIKDIKKEDKLIIYYSGHGHFDKSTDLGYWIPFDAKKGKTANYILNSSIHAYIKAIKALHILLISDSCFAGSLFVRGANRSDSALSELEKHVSRWAICSGRHDEEVYDGIPGKNSPFADSILYVLKHNRLPKFNVAKLADKVLELTKSNYDQLPEGNPLHAVGHKGGQYVFRLKMNELDDWKTCQNESDLDTYKLFIEKYPMGQFLAEAKRNLDRLEQEDAWQKVRYENNILAYFEFREKFPNSYYSRKALDAIAKLEEGEQQAWQDASIQNSIAAYRKYLADFPQGESKIQAEHNIRELFNKQHEDSLWLTTKTSNSISSFSKYIDEYPSGRYLLEAKRKIEELKKKVSIKEDEVEEVVAWKVTENANSQEAYQLFLNRYPQSRFAPKARDEIKKIKSGQFQSQKTQVQKPPREQQAKRPESKKQQPDKEGFKRPQPKARQPKRPPSNRKSNTDLKKKPKNWILPIILLISGTWLTVNLTGIGASKNKPKVLTVMTLEQEVGKLAIKVKNLRFDLKENRVAIFGEISSQSDKENVISALAKIPGVKEVDDQLVISSESIDQEDTAPLSSEGFRPEIEINTTEKRVTITTSNGTAPYELKLIRNGQVKFRKKILTQGTNNILLANFLRDPGQYSIELKDGDGKFVSKDLMIHPGSKPTKNSLTLDGKSYRIVNINQRTWLAENLNYDIPNSWCFQGKDSNCQDYGRLYTWEAAREGCKALGSGWRLPSDEEWIQLAKKFGGYYDWKTRQSIGDSRKGYKSLTVGGSSNFNALLGGWRYSRGEFDYIGVSGSYWSGTEFDEDNSWGYYLLEGKLDRIHDLKTYARSCRCIKN